VARPPSVATAFTPTPGGVSRVPVPSDEGFMSTNDKMSLADIALALRDEQLQAKVVHYKAELQTSPELDKITEQVVDGLRALQKQAQASHPASQPPVDRAQVEIDLIQTMKIMLSRLFRPEKLTISIERKLGEVTKRFARIFFESELHVKIQGSATEMKAMRYPDQALFHVLSRNEPALVKQLEGFEYHAPSVLADAKEALADWIKNLRNEFLGRSTPELNALVQLLNESLTTFFTEELPPLTGELAWEVVKEGRLGEFRARSGYTISVEAFPRFRQAFERRFLQRLVPFAEEEMLKRVRATEGKFRAETIRFVADPQIFTDVCELVCDAVYDFLYNDGFLDLPTDWRKRLTTAAS